MQKNIKKNSLLFCLFCVVLAGCTKMEFTRTNDLSKYNLSDIQDNLFMMVGDTLSVDKLDIINLDHFIFQGGVSEQFRVLDHDTVIGVSFVDVGNRTKSSRLEVRPNTRRFTKNEDELSIYGAFSDTQRISTSMGVFYNTSDEAYQLTVYKYPYELTIQLFNNFPGKLYGHQQQYVPYNSMNSSAYYGKSYFKATLLTAGGIGGTSVLVYDKNSVVRFIESESGGKYRLDLSHVLFENTSTNEQVYIDVNYNNL